MKCCLGRGKRYKEKGEDIQAEKKKPIGGIKECRSSRREARAQEEENMGIERRKEKWIVMEKGERGRRSFKGSDQKMRWV